MPVNWWDVAEVDPWVERIRAEKERQRQERAAAEAAARAKAAAARAAAQAAAQTAAQARTPSPTPTLTPSQRGGGTYAQQQTAAQQTAAQQTAQARPEPPQPEPNYYASQSLGQLERPIANPLSAGLDPWVERYRRENQQGPQPQPQRDFSTMGNPSPWGQALAWLGSTPAVDLYRERRDENQAREYRSSPAPAQPVPPMGPTVESKPPVVDAFGEVPADYWYRPAYEPVANRAEAWQPTPGQSQQEQDLNRWATESRGLWLDPLAAWRNVTRLPGVGQPAEGVERTAIDWLSGLNVPFDLSKSETPLGEYAGAAWDVATEKLKDPASLIPRSWDQVWQDITHPLGPDNAGKIFEGYLPALERVRAASGGDAGDSYLDRFARINSVSGAEAIARTRSEMMNREETAAKLDSQAQRIQAQFLDNPNVPEVQRQAAALRAAELGRKANEIRTMTNSQIVDRNMNLAAEIGFSFLIDPLEWMGWGTTALQMGSTARRMRAGVKSIPTAEEAVTLLRAATAGTEGERVMGQVSAVNRSWWQTINPWALTADALAELDAAALYQLHVNLLQGVETKADAVRILRENAMNPAGLIEEGLGDLQGPRLRSQADPATGRVYWGGNLAQPDAMRARGVYGEIGERLEQLPSLQGEGPLDRRQLMWDLDGLVYDAARNMHGVSPFEMPAGMSKVVPTALPDGRVKLDYYGPGGTLIRSDGPLAAQEAAARLKQAQEGVKQNFARRFAGMQRGLMSELFLNMSPSHWMRNGVSAAGHLMTDGVMTLEPSDSLRAYLAAKTGGLPATRRMASGDGGVAEMIRADRAGKINPNAESSMFRSIPVIGDALGKWSETGQKVWTGDTSIDLGFLSVPVGEENFVLRGFTVPFRRIFDEQWGRVVDGLGEVFQQMGVDRETARAVRAAVLDAGVQGGRADVNETIRRVTQEMVLPFSPEAFGIPADALTPEGWGEIRSAVTSGQPIAQVRRQVDEVFDRDLWRYGSVIGEAPPEPGRRVYSDADSLQDGAGFLDQAERAGVRREEAAAIWQQKEQAESEGLAAVVQAAQGLEAERVMPTLVEMWADLFEQKRRTRMANGAAVEPAIESESGAAWARYFATAQQNWGQYSQDVAGLFGRALQAVNDIAAGVEVPRRGDGWDFVRRFLNYDEADVARARGLQPGSPKYDRETFAQVIEANRAFVDREVSRAWAAAWRYMDGETLDVLLSAERDTQVSGAKAAGFVSALRQEMLDKKLALGKYYEQRNQAWRELAEEQAARWRAAQYEIVGAKVDPAVRADVTMTVNPGFGEPVTYEAAVLGPAGKDPTSGEQRWRVQALDDFAGPEEKVLPESQVPQEVRERWQGAQEEARRRVDEEVAGLEREGAKGREGVASSVADVPVHPAIPVDDVEAQAAWREFAQGNPELAAQRVRESLEREGGKGREGVKPTVEMKPEVDFFSAVRGEGRGARAAGVTDELQLESIPWRRLNSKGVEESGSSTVVDIAGRKIVVRRVNGVNVPFYLSTGLGEKVDTVAGKWYPFVGINPNSGWLNKTHGSELTRYYDSPTLRRLAEELDANLGDMRNASVERVSVRGAMSSFINAPFKRVYDFDDKGAEEGVQANIRALRKRFGEDDPFLAVGAAKRREAEIRAGRDRAKSASISAEKHATSGAQPVIPFRDLPEEVRQGLDWRLLRGMTSDNAAEELGISRRAAADRRAALAAQKFIELTEQRPGRATLVGPGQVGVFRVTGKGKRRLSTLDGVFGNVEVGTGTALARTGERTMPVFEDARIVDAPQFADVPAREVEIVDGVFRRVGRERLTGPTVGQPPRLTAGEEGALLGPGIPMGGPGQRRLTTADGGRQTAGGVAPRVEAATPKRVRSKASASNVDTEWNQLQRRKLAIGKEMQELQAFPGFGAHERKSKEFRLRQLRDELIALESKLDEMTGIGAATPTAATPTPTGDYTDGVEVVAASAKDKYFVEVTTGGKRQRLGTRPLTLEEAQGLAVQQQQAQQAKPKATPAVTSQATSAVEGRRVALPGAVDSPYAQATHMFQLGSGEVPVRVLGTRTGWATSPSKKVGRGTQSVGREGGGDKRFVTFQLMQDTPDPADGSIVWQRGDILEAFDGGLGINEFPRSMRVLGEDERLRLLKQPGLGIETADGGRRTAVSADVEAVAQRIEDYGLYQRAVKNSTDWQNAEITIDNMIVDAVTDGRRDNLQLYKQYVDDPAFKAQFDEQVKRRLQPERYGENVRATDVGRVDTGRDGALAGTQAEDGAVLRQPQRATQGGEGRGAGDVASSRGLDSQRDAGTRSVEPGAGAGVSAQRGGSTGTGAGDAALRGGVAVDGGRGGERAAETLPVPTRRRETGTDYVIPDGGRSLGAGGAKTKYRGNVDAISTLKVIEGQGRRATPEEQAILAKYVGWGDSALANNVLEDRRYGRGEWENEFQELKGLLTKEEWESAARSTPNAHYTSGPVVSSMYDALRRMGAGNLPHARWLEPGAGVGNFLGLMPGDLAARSSRTAVELDSLSGRILQQLYPNADVFVGGFQDAPLADNYFDFVVSNFPFGAYSVNDVAFKHPARKFAQKSIHNYFFAKSMDKVRPGGVVAAITSHFTMDGVEAKRLREYLAEQGDFIGAIRLPSSAFKANAGTEVTTDIIFLRKRMPGEERAGAAWANVTQQVDANGQKFLRNEYFDAHPEMILGREELAGTMYRGGEYTVTAGEQPLEELLAAAVGRLPENIIQPAERQAAVQSISTIKGAQGVKEGGHGVVGGKLVRRTRGQIVAVDGEAADIERISGMLDVRDKARDVIQAQLDGVDDAGLAAVQAKLNQSYDAFAKKHGTLNSTNNRKLMQYDPDGPFLLALENTERDTKGKITQTGKAAIFRERVVRERGAVKSAANGKDALLVSLSERNRVDMDHMAQLTGRAVDELASELEGVVYKNPIGDWETADEYLSGNVRSKLQSAEQAAKFDPKYRVNVDALQAALPEDYQPSRISVKLGAPWVPQTIVEDYIRSLLGSSIDVRHIESQGAWTVGKMPTWNRNDVANTQRWGTDRYSALELIDDGLNQRTPTVWDSVGRGKDKTTTLNVDATLAARAKLEEIQKRFAEWMWIEPNRAAEMSSLYNERFNFLVRRTFDGSHLTLPGSNPSITMRPHQKDVIWRGLQGGNLMMAHEVGAGKTFAAIGMGMELRRTGLSRKNMYVVPKSLVGQWEADFLKMYPGANILVADAKSFEPANRNRLMSQIATGDWDAVIVSIQQFEKLPVRDETFNRYIEGELAVLRDYLRELKSTTNDKNDRTVKQINTALLRMESKLRAPKNAVDNTIYFEELGIDQLFVDEAHLFKNLFFPTKMQRVAGLPQSDAARASDMFIKTQYLTKRNNGRGIVFMTGTPISNSISEAYTMLRYLDYDQLQEMGISHFDSWAAQFGDNITQMEMATSGEFKQKTRFSQFNNIPVLSELMQRTFDIQKTADMGLPNMPKLANGERRIVAAPRTDDIEAFLATLVERSEVVSKPGNDKRVDNMLKITTDGRKGGLDMRLIDPTLPDQPNSKANQAVREILEVYRRTDDVKGTQIVFSDLGVPKGVQQDGERFMFDVYADVKSKLVAGGIPANKIAFIHDAKNDRQRVELFRKVRAGEVRVLMGSTEKMGVGVNVQDRLAALHHLDTPYRPSDLEQREGRILRQRNNQLFPEVEVFQYVQEPLDAVMWQIVESKAKAIHAIMQKDPGIDSLIDGDTGSAIVLSAAQIKAAAAGDPDLLRHVTLKAESEKLQSLRRSFGSARAQRKIEQGRWPNRIGANEKWLGEIEADIARRDQMSKGAEFSIELNGVTYTDRAEATKELQEIAVDFKGRGQTTEIGTYRGFTLEIVPSSKRENDPSLNILGESKYVSLVSLPSVDQTLRNLEGRRDNLRKEIANMQRQFAELQSFVEPPFEHEQRLAELRQELDAIENRLFKPAQSDTLIPASEMTIDGTVVDDDVAVYESTFPRWEPNEQQQSLIDRILNRTNPQRQATRTTGAPEIGDMAGYRALYGEDARRAMQERLADIVMGMPNGLSQAQRNAILEWSARAGLPGFDETLAKATAGGKKVSDFAMLNYAQRRNIDQWLSLLVPYHYWFTRSALNWVERAAMRPGLAAQYARLDRAADEDVERRGLPTRFEGTVPIPGTDYRMRNPMDLLLPFGQLYAKQGFEEPSEETTWYGKMFALASNMGFGLLPVYDMALKAGTGKKDQIRPVFWMDTMLYRAQQAMGRENPWTPETALRQAMGLPAVDNWDPYRLARMIAIQTQRGDVPKELAKWAQDMIVAEQRGLDVLPEMPAGMDQYLAAAEKEMGSQLFLTMLTSKLLGAPIYKVDPEEVALKGANEKRGELAYGPENQTGSRTAQYQLDEQYPGLGAWRARGATIPGNEDWERPGMGAAREDYWTQRTAILDEMNRETEALYGANPQATYEDKQAVQAPYWAQVDAMGDAPYPRESSPEYDPDQGKAPWELQRAQYEGIVAQFAKDKSSKPEWPGSDAPWHARQAWFAANRAWLLQQGVDLEKALRAAGLDAFLEVPQAVPSLDLPDWMKGFDPSQRSGREILDEYGDRFKGPNEKGAEKAQAGAGVAAQRDRNNAYAAGQASSQAERRKKVGEEEGYWTEAEWAAIQAELDKYPFNGTSEEKRAYLLANPALAAYWKDKYGDAWWEREAKVYSRSAWGGGGGNVTYPPDVRQRFMDPSLWRLSNDDTLPKYRAPVDRTRDWLLAGSELRPDAIKAWTPRR
jgi:N12 class adenine-specific DNA methylase